MDELFNQTQNVYANQELKKEKFTKQIAFNAIPHIGAPMCGMALNAICFVNFSFFNSWFA